MRFLLGAAAEPPKSEEAVRAALEVAFTRARHAASAEDRLEILQDLKTRARES